MLLCGIFKFPLIFFSCEANNIFLKLYFISNSWFFKQVVLLLFLIVILISRISRTGIVLGILLLWKMEVLGLQKTDAYLFSIEFNIPAIFRWACYCCWPEGAVITAGVVLVENHGRGQQPVVESLEGISRQKWFPRIEEMFYLFVKIPLLWLMVKFTWNAFLVKFPLTFALRNMLL